MKPSALFVALLLCADCRGTQSTEPKEEPISSAPARPSGSVQAGDPGPPAATPTVAELPSVGAGASPSAGIATPSEPILPARAAAGARATSAPASATASAAPQPSAASEAPSGVKAPSVAPRRGASASGPSYEAWLETTGGYRPHEAGTVVVVLNAKAPYKCNTQYPYKFALDPPGPDVNYPSSLVRGMRVDGKHATMPVPFTATSVGSHTVAGTLSFSTCTEDKCLVDKAHLTVSIDVR